jgi:hypothetical protein
MGCLATVPALPAPNRGVQVQCNNWIRPVPIQKPLQMQGYESFGTRASLATRLFPLKLRAFANVGLFSYQLTSAPGAIVVLYVVNVDPVFCLDVFCHGSCLISDIG